MGALAEDSSVMKISIGNIAPSEEVRIEIALTEELPISVNTFYRYSLKSTLHPQLNQLAEELLGVQKSAHEWTCKLRVRSSRKVVAYQSPSHKIELEKRNDADTDLSFTVVPSADLSTEFTFLYSTECFEIPTYTLGRTDAGSTVMVSFIPKFCPLSLSDAQVSALSLTPTY
jgi:hypothetical protein